MGYIYLDDHFDEHPKVLAAGRRAAWLYICGLLYCHRNHTPGTIPKAVVPTLTGAREWREHVGSLRDSCLWTELTDHYEINDYMQWNARSFAAHERAKKAAHTRWANHDKDAPSNAQAYAQALLVGDAPSNASAMPTDPRNQGTTNTPTSNSRPPALTDEDEDRIETEARRRMNQLPQPPNHPTAWLAVTKANIRREHDQNIRWQPKDPPTHNAATTTTPDPNAKPATRQAGSKSTTRNPAQPDTHPAKHVPDEPDDDELRRQRIGHHWLAKIRAQLRNQPPPEPEPEQDDPF